LNETDNDNSDCRFYCRIYGLLTINKSANKNDRATAGAGGRLSRPARPAPVGPKRFPPFAPPTVSGLSVVFRTRKTFHLFSIIALLNFYPIFTAALFSQSKTKRRDSLPVAIVTAVQ